MDYRTEEEIRKSIIETGLWLIENKLVTRTWGNISAKVSDEEFIITPSGRTYDSLKPEELVKVRIDDCTYEGNIKPSSETGLHAVCYALRPDVVDIVHTHQFYASVLSVPGGELPFVSCAHHEPAGSEELRDSVAECVKEHPEHNAFLMQKHGAITFGTEDVPASKRAEELEAVCRAYFEKASGISVRSEDEFVGIWSRRKKRLLPYLDDFCQLVGAGVNDAAHFENEFKGPAEDLEAAKAILAKNCACAVYNSKCGGCRPFGLIDALKQRYTYLFKYSKRKKTNV